MAADWVGDWVLQSSFITSCLAHSPVTLFNYSADTQLQACTRRRARRQTDGAPSVAVTRETNSRTSSSGRLHTVMKSRRHDGRRQRTPDEVRSTSCVREVHLDVHKATTSWRNKCLCERRSCDRRCQTYSEALLCVCSQYVTQNKCKNDVRNVFIVFFLIHCTFFTF